jgi:hypothetical protein
MLIWAIDYTSRNGMINLISYDIPTAEYLHKKLYNHRKDIREELLVRERRIIKSLLVELGEHESAIRKAAVAEKFAERAFTVANAASLGVIALQKSLAIPRIMTKEQAQKNQLAKSNIDKLFTTGGQFDFLRPVLSDEDNALLDDIEEHNAKQNGI